MWPIFTYHYNQEKLYAKGTNPVEISTFQGVNHEANVKWYHEVRNTPEKEIDQID